MLCAFLYFSLLTIGREAQAKNVGTKKPHMLGTHMQQLTRAKQAKPRWVSRMAVCGKRGTGLRWTKRRYQVRGQSWADHGAASKPKPGPLSGTANQRPRRGLQAWEGRDQLSGRSESLGQEGQLPLHPALHLSGLRPWVRKSERLEGGGTENGHAGRRDL